MARSPRSRFAAGWTVPTLVALGLVGSAWGTAAQSATPARQPAYFAERAAASGLDFVHFNGMTGELYFPECMGGGVALLDFDRDGDLDLFFPQGTLLDPGRNLDEAILPPPAAMRPLGDRLYRNDLVITPDGSVTNRFVDVSAGSGLGSGYGMGATTGDVDGDGWVDLYVTRFGANALYRNRGDGTFEEITDRSGTGDPSWSVSAVFFDRDDDGDLDLYVANYVRFTVAGNVRCFSPSSAPDYCGPQAYPAVADTLYDNRGDGTFDDVSAEAGIAGAAATGLGVAAADLDGDGRTDLYVANDMQPNFLWLNRDGRSFEEAALLAGAAVNEQGRAEASMGVAIADPDGDGDLDLFLTHLAQETNTYYRNAGGAIFVDETAKTGLGPPSFAMTAFGTGWLDIDNDGRLDLISANGEVKRIEAQVAAGDLYPLHQANQLFRQFDRQRWRELPAAEAGPDFERSEVSRGVAIGDLDNDGDADVVIANNSGPARLLVNRRGERADWLGVDLVARSGAPEIGGRVTLSAGDERRHRSVTSGGSYASAGDPREIFGLGAGASALRPSELSVRGRGGALRLLRPPVGAYLRWPAPPVRRAGGGDAGRGR